MLLHFNVFVAVTSPNWRSKKSPSLCLQRSKNLSDCLLWSHVVQLPQTSVWCLPAPYFPHISPSFLFCAVLTVLCPQSPSTFAVLGEQLCSMRTEMNNSSCNMGCKPVTQQAGSVGRAWCNTSQKSSSLNQVGFCRAAPFSRSPCWGIEMLLHLLSYMKFLKGKIHWQKVSTVLSECLIFHGDLTNEQISVFQSFSGAGNSQGCEEWKDVCQVSVD